MHPMHSHVAHTLLDPKFIFYSGAFTNTCIRAAQERKTQNISLPSSSSHASQEKHELIHTLCCRFIRLRVQISHISSSQILLFSSPSSNHSCHSRGPTPHRPPTPCHHSALPPSSSTKASVISTDAIQFAKLYPTNRRRTFPSRW